MSLLFAALLVLLAAGLAALATTRSGRVAGVLGASGAPLAALLGAVPVARVLGGGETLRMELPWSVPGGSLSLALDPLSAFFLVPVLVLSALSALYGRAYLAPYANRRRLGATWLFFNLLCAAMITVVLARNGVLFLVAWETMSLCAFALVTFEHERADARRAGWIYLVAAHVGTAALLALFVLLGGAFGGAVTSATTAIGSRETGLFVLALLGFGVKAGLVPLHVWLPEAHAAAPSHVSALMSGAMVKLGFYGILRVILVLGGVAPVWGPLLGAIGLTGSLVAIALSLSQRDLKRALAYSSVENLGIIALALGIGLTALARDDKLLAAFGIAAGLFHVWNHAALKGLLFFAAGSVQRGAGTRDLERLGGLLRSMPRSGMLFAVGSLGLAALPPFNGFASEWLLYIGLLHGVSETRTLPSIVAALALALLALVGGLASAAFVRLFGAVFLGEPRRPDERPAHDVGGAMLGVMVGLALFCVAVGVAPIAALAAVRAPVQQLLGNAGGEHALEPVTSALAPIETLAPALWGAVALVGAMLALWIRRMPRAFDATWACGYAAVGSRMQYTAGSFGALLSSCVVPRALAPTTDSPGLRGTHPAAGEFRARHDEPISTRIYEPIFSAFASRFARLRLLQQGNAHLYLGYILAAVVAALAWTSLQDWLRP